MDIFRKRRIENLAFMAALAALAAASSLASGFDAFKALGSYGKSFAWFLVNLQPDGASLEKLPSVTRRLLETLNISVIASIVASPGALLFALAASNVLRLPKAVSAFSRIVSSLFRNIPVAAWAMVFLFSFGQTAFSGFLALSLSSFGFLSRVFTDTIDQKTGESVEALRASGASYAHTIAQAVLPDAMPQLLSWILFMIETNIRSATLVGILTGSGIGFSFMLYYRNLDYRAASLVMLAIVLTVLLVESISNAVRRAIL